MSSIDRNSKINIEQLSRRSSALNGQNSEHRWVENLLLNKHFLKKIRSSYEFLDTHEPMTISVKYSTAIINVSDGSEFVEIQISNV